MTFDQQIRRLTTKLLPAYVLSDGASSDRVNGAFVVPAHGG